MVGTTTAGGKEIIANLTASGQFSIFLKLLDATGFADTLQTGGP